MREVKFRGQRVDNGEWVYGYLHMAYTASSGFIEMGFYITEFKNESFIDHEIIGTQSEYTGLQDKNGKEIYEGDLIDYGSGRHYPITFEKGKFGIKFPNGSHEGCWLDISKFEVIGNIYENPELISKQLVK